jgi:Lon protease-like protein
VHDITEAAAIRDLAAFGVLFTSGGDRLSQVGTEAEVLARHEASHGRLDVEAVGRRRFEAEEAMAGAAEVVYLEEDPGPGDLALLRSELEAACRRYAAAAVESGEAGRIGARLHSDPRLAVYQASMLMPLSHPERQELLEMATTTERFEWLLRVAAGETGLLRHVLATGRMR